MPGRHVPGYVIHRETGEPRNYRLNGLLVFVVAQVLWWFELTGMPRDWFYRSSLYAVAGGTVLTIITTIIAVFSQPEGEVKNRFLAWWFGRAQEMQFFNGRSIRHRSSTGSFPASIEQHLLRQCPAGSRQCACRAWALQDSNLRPPPCKGGALAN